MRNIKSKDATPWTTPWTPEGFPLFPPLAIPMERKNDFVCPAGHLEQLRSCIPKVTKLLMIGWHATDAPFIQLLIQNQPVQPMSLHVVCGAPSEGKEVVSRIVADGLRVKDVESDYSGFSKFIRTGAAQKFLQL